MKWESGSRYIALVVCFLTWYLVILSRTIISPLLPLVSSEFGLSYAESGLIITSLLVGDAIMLFLGGGLAGIVERKKIIISGLILGTFASLLISYSASYWQLIVSQFLLGLGAGCYLAPANAILSDIFPQAERGRAFGIHEAAVSLGTFSAALFSAPIAVRSGWRTSFLLSAVTFPIMAFVFWRLVKESRREGRPSKGFSTGLAVAFRPRFILMYLSYALGVGFCWSAFSSFLPTYLVNVFRVDLVHAAILVSVVSLSGIVGRLTSGPISDKLGRKRVTVLWLIIVSSSIFLLTRISNPDTSLTLILIITGYTLNGLVPIAFAFLADIMPPPLRGVGFGFMTSMSMTAGALSGFAVGYIADTAGFVTAFTFISLLEVSSIPLMLKAG